MMINICQFQNKFFHISLKVVLKETNCYELCVDELFRGQICSEKSGVLEYSYVLFSYAVFFNFYFLLSFFIFFINFERKYSLISFNFIDWLFLYEHLNFLLILKKS